MAFGVVCFFLNGPATTVLYTRSLHDALPILTGAGAETSSCRLVFGSALSAVVGAGSDSDLMRSSRAASWFRIAAQAVRARAMVVASPKGTARHRVNSHTLETRLRGRFAGALLRP